MANSFVRYTGDNSTTSYSIPFSYRATGDLTVTLSGVASTAFTLNSAGTTLTFTSAPAQDAAIEIRRKTSQTTKLVDYASGSVLTENDLDTDSDQAFFMSQEAIDDAGDVIKLSNTDFQYDATNKRITNVADPVNAQDLATKNYLENTFLTSANKTALTTVNANISNINAVNSNASNINSAVSNATNINTVATNIGSVNTVATDITKVIAVANDLAEAVSEVETVADDLNEATSEIDTVATNIANVNTVGTAIANVNTVAGISANVTTVAGNNSNVSTVAGISGDVTSVAGIASDVSAVENIKANVTTVAGIDSDVTSVAGISSAVSAVNSNSTNINAVNANSANINTVAGNNTNVTTVAGVSSDVSTVAGISSDVQAVENIASNVTTVAGANSNITAVAGAITNINNVGGAITNVNNVGGSIANVNTVASNLASVNAFGEQYRISSSAPTSSLTVGDLYFDTTANELKVYKSSGWAAAGSTVNGTSARFNYIATAGQTTFTGADTLGNTLAYDSGFADCYLNGVRLSASDVTITSGTSVVISAATVGDVLDIVAYGTFNVAAINGSAINAGTINIDRLPSITNAKLTGSIANDKLANNSITINGSAVSLGGSVTVGETKPTITSTSLVILPTTATSVTIAGTNFASSSTVLPIVEAVTSGGVLTRASVVSWSSATSISATFNLAQGDYRIRVENPDGNAVISANAILQATPAPTWTTSAGNISTIAGGASIGTLSVVASSDSAVTYAKTSGTLPNGISINSSGVFSGTESGSTATTVYSFDVTTTDAEAQTAVRTFTITISHGATGGGQFN